MSWVIIISIKVIHVDIYRSVLTLRVQHFYHLHCQLVLFLFFTTIACLCDLAWCGMQGLHCMPYILIMQPYILLCSCFVPYAGSPFICPFPCTILFPPCPRKYGLVLIIIFFITECKSVCLSGCYHTVYTYRARHFFFSPLK